MLVYLLAVISIVVVWMVHCGVLFVCVLTEVVLLVLNLLLGYFACTLDLLLERWFNDDGFVCCGLF